MLEDLHSHFEPILRNLTDTEEKRLSGIWDTYTIVSRPSKSDRRRMELFVYIEGNSTVEAMLSAVNIDHLKGINYRLRKLSGCNNVFEVKRPDKEYCGHPCAHKALVYGKRDEARKAEEAALGLEGGSKQRQLAL